MTLLEAAKQFLHEWEYGRFVAQEKAVDALRQAIEQAEKQELVAWVELDGELVWHNRTAAVGKNLYTAPPQAEKQKPVAWRTYGRMGLYVISSTFEEAERDFPGKHHQPLYTTPQREWVGLTDEDMCEAFTPGESYANYAQAIEAKLKEKNT